MTREQAKNLLPILQAYADGKTIEYCSRGFWEPVDIILLGDVDRTPENYRIKPEPTYRPFANAEECWQEMQKHQPFGWVTFRDNKEYIVRVTETVIKMDDSLYYDYAEAKFKFHFADGEPFGIKEETV